MYLASFWLVAKVLSKPSIFGHSAKA